MKTRSEYGKVIQCFGHTNEIYFWPFSGGPLLSELDKSFIGVTSTIVRYPFSRDIWFQRFTFVPYYYEWIEGETGLNLPKCNKEDSLELFYEKFGE